MSVRVLKASINVLGHCSLRSVLTPAVIAWRNSLRRAQVAGPLKKQSPPARKRAAEGSDVICIAIVGGATIPPLTGHVADITAPAQVVIYCRLPGTLAIHSTSRGASKASLTPPNALRAGSVSGAK